MWKGGDRGGGEGVKGRASRMDGAGRHGGRGWGKQCEKWELWGVKNRDRNAGEDDEGNEGDGRGGKRGGGRGKGGNEGKGN